MAVAKPHPQQAERLKALYSFEILDTPQEAEFDEIVALAAATCGTAISVINFIDADRQWFKAEVGLGVRETPLATSICSHVILEEEFVEISDTLLDPRMVDNPLCCGDPGLRFYAGALLRTGDGLPLGTLCVLDHGPRSLTGLQRDTLRVLARQVMARLDLRKSLRHADLLRQEVDHRVKNSLQSLASYVRLMGRDLPDGTASDFLSSIQARIEATASLHEVLYRTEAGPVIDLHDFFAGLRQIFTRNMPGNVTLQFDLESMEVSSSEAVALGTLVNECISNSLKHGFPDGRPGSIRVSIRKGQENGEVCVSYQDDGVGLPEQSTPVRPGLGLKVSQTIARELRGKYDLRPQQRGILMTLDFRSAV